MAWDHFPIAVNDEITNDAVNELIDALSERGVTSYSYVATGQALEASLINAMQTSVENLIPNYIDPDNGNAYTKASLFTKLGIGIDNDWTLIPLRLGIEIPLGTPYELAGKVISDSQRVIEHLNEMYQVLNALTYKAFSSSSTLNLYKYGEVYTFHTGEDNTFDGARIPCYTNYQSSTPTVGDGASLKYYYEGRMVGSPVNEIEVGGYSNPVIYMLSGRTIIYFDVSSLSGIDVNSYTLKSSINTGYDTRVFYSEGGETSIPSLSYLKDPKTLVIAKLSGNVYEDGTEIDSLTSTGSILTSSKDVTSLISTSSNNYFHLRFDSDNSNFLPTSPNDIANYYIDHGYNDSEKSFDYISAGFVSCVLLADINYSKRGD